MLFGLFCVPVLRRTVPESSYTVTCLPLQTVTESCRFVITRLVQWQQFHFSLIVMAKPFIYALLITLTLVTHTPLMWISDCRVRLTPVVNWVMLSWVGESCTAAICWLKWADITCSLRITTVFELLAASRFRLEPHWNGGSSGFQFPEDYYTHIDIVMFMHHCRGILYQELRV